MLTISDDGWKTPKICKVGVVVDRPVIGSKFIGKNLFVDTANGYCWSVGQMLTQGEQLVQAAINRKDNKVKPLRVDSRMVLPRPVATALVTQIALDHV